MVLRGLTEVGRDALAHDIARNHLDNVVTVFEKTGTVHENYAPESAAPAPVGRPADRGARRPSLPAGQRRLDRSQLRRPPRAHRPAARRGGRQRPRRGCSALGGRLARAEDWTLTGLPVTPV
jgi:hypothetical protein